MLLTALPALLSPVTSEGGSRRAPEEVAGAITVDATTAKRLFEDGVLFIDVRRARDRAAGTIPDAAYLELRGTYDRNAVNNIAAEEKPLLLFSSGEWCLRAGKAAEEAVSWGYRNVYYFRGGFPAWEAAGLPVEGTPAAR